jgi:hypothetical protein
MERRELVISPGAEVVDSEGEVLGTVQDVMPDYLVVAKGRGFPSDRYIPAGAIREANEQTVSLTVSKDEALGQKWEHPPTAAAADTATPGVTNRATVTAAAGAGVPEGASDQARSTTAPPTRETPPAGSAPTSPRASTATNAPTSRGPGGAPMTEAQATKLRTLLAEAGKGPAFDPHWTQAEAEQLIDALAHERAYGAPGQHA